MKFSLLELKTFMRHKHISTTMKYVDSDEEGALDKIFKICQQAEKWKNENKDLNKIVIIVLCAVR